MATEESRHSVSVAAAVMDSEGKFLAIRRRDNNRWEPPGGILELNETIHDGLTREVLEETGLRVKPVALSGIYKNMQRGIVALVFRCQIIDGQLRPTNEAAEVRWMTPPEINLEMDDAYACRLLDALNTHPPMIRAHDGVDLLNAPAPPSTP